MSKPVMPNEVESPAYEFLRSVVLKNAPDTLEASLELRVRSAVACLPYEKSAMPTNNNLSIQGSLPPPVVTIAAPPMVKPLQLAGGDGN